MTIFNISSRDTEPLIISNLPHQDQVALSGVNKNAYQLLSNKPYFYNLFLSKYCSFETVEKQLEKKLAVFCNNHPSNCWKIVCCVFQASRTNFNPSFFNVEIADLKKQKDKYESRIKGICGDFYEDPSSPIHQAWLAYQNQRSICALCEIKMGTFMQKVFYPVVVKTGRLKEFEAFQESITSKEEGEAIIGKFDERLMPFINLMNEQQEAVNKCKNLHLQYQDLEKERQDCADSVDRINGDIKLLSTSFGAGKKYFLTPLSTHLYDLLSLVSGRATSDDDIRHTLKAWSYFESPDMILQARQFLAQTRPDLVGCLEQTSTPL